MKKSKYTPPKCPTSGYRFVFAANLYKSFGGYSIYLKYKRGNPGEIVLKDYTSTHAWFICPDREIVIVRNNQELGAFYPMGESFDEVYDFNNFNDEAARAMGIEYAMTNFVHTTGSVKNRRLESTVAEEHRIHMLSDSGGLQLSRDTTGLIHPKDLITFYNNNVDAGMCLDIPLVVSDSKITERAARLQKKNNEIMLKHSEGVELINIFHGHSVEDRKLYRDIVEDERINRVAIGGLHRQHLLTSVNTIYNTVLGGKKRYKQYHMLGIFGAAYIPLMVKIANSGENPPHITSDSTSHIQSASNKAYHFQWDITSTSKRLAIGTRATIPNTERHLPCQCAICRVIKYTDILAFGPNRVVLELLALHNGLEMSRYSLQLEEACKQLPPSEYNKLVATQLKRHPELKEVMACLDFIDITVKHGQKDAKKKYENSLNRGRTSKQMQIPAKTLFGDDSEAMLQKKHDHVVNLLTKLENQIK